jgi:hypothetical protein
MRRRDAYRIGKEPSKEPEKVVKPGECPKCGRVIGRGIAFHIKACKGIADDDIRQNPRPDSG